MALITVVLTSGTTWTVPADWNSGANSIICIGAGAGGRTATSLNRAGTGGGGGGFSSITNFTLTPSSSVNIQVGTGGTAGLAGGDTWFNKTAASAPASTSDGVLAQGGQAPTISAGGLGGAAASGVGTFKSSGGAGGANSGNNTSAAGGGGAGGAQGDGGAGGVPVVGTSGGRGAGGGGGSGGGGSGTVGQAGGVGSSNTGGNGGNNAAGAGGATGNTSFGTAGTVGGGGAGAGSSGGGLFGDAGGTGGTGTDYNSSLTGPGGGGGGASGGTNSTPVGNGGAGGPYGGGGGGGGLDGATASNLGTGGTGANGVIIITYNATFGNTLTFAPSDFPNPRGAARLNVMPFGLDLGQPPALRGQDKFYGAPGEGPPQYDWPVPNGPVPAIILKTLPWMYNITPGLNDLTPRLAFQQYDWPVPRGYTHSIDLKTFTYNRTLILDVSQYTLSLRNYDFPNPRGYTPLLRTHVKPLELNLLGQDRFFSAPGVGPQYDYPNPRPAPRLSELRGHINSSSQILDQLTLVLPKPGVQHNWPVPAGYTYPLSLRGSTARSILFARTPYSFGLILG